MPRSLPTGEPCTRRPSATWRSSPATGRAVRSDSSPVVPAVSTPPRPAHGSRSRWPRSTSRSAPTGAASTPRTGPCCLHSPPGKTARCATARTGALSQPRRISRTGRAGRADPLHSQRDARLASAGGAKPRRQARLRRRQAARRRRGLEPGERLLAESKVSLAPTQQPRRRSLTWPLCGLAVFVAAAVWAAAALGFGTYGFGGQQYEHLRITRAALDCHGRDSGGGCFETESIAQLAGREPERGVSGWVGAVGAPDKDQIQTPAAHCDNADFLSGYYAEEMRRRRNERLAACWTHLRNHFWAGVRAAEGLLDRRAGSSRARSTSMPTAPTSSRSRGALNAMSSSTSDACCTGCRTSTRTATGRIKPTPIGRYLRSTHRGSTALCPRPSSTCAGATWGRSPMSSPQAASKTAAPTGSHMTR
jgi:hypothetical protein